MLKTQAEVLQAARGFQTAAIIMALVEIKLGATLAALPNGATLTQLATTLNCKARNLVALLNASTALGLTVLEAERYHLSETGNACLNPQSAGYLGAQIASYTAQYQGWGNLPHALRTGETVLPDLQSNPDAATLRRLIYGLHRGAQTSQAAILVHLIPLLADAKWLLDVGGGAGTYALACLEQQLDMQAVLLDKPEVLELAREIQAEHPAFARLYFAPADYLTARFTEYAGGEKYDVILFFQVLRTESSETIIKLLQKAAQALQPNGWLVIYDTQLDDNHTAPLENVIQNLTMTLMYQAGGLFSASQLTEWLTKAGFNPPEIFNIAALRPMTLYLAQMAG